MTIVKKFAQALCCATVLGVPSAALAQAEPYYKGKTISVLVGLDAGGTVDLFARVFTQYMQKHLKGSPTIIVQNMPGAGGLIATNFVSEKSKPDGLTFLWGPWDPLAQALKLPNMRARYENFEFLGGTGDTRVLYANASAIPEGMKKPADIAKAETLVVGALNPTDPSGLLAHLALEVLGINNKMIIGYKGGSDVFLALQRGEVNFHSTSITTFRGRNSEYIRSGRGIGVGYLVSVDQNGAFTPNPFIAEMPAFPDLYREIHGKLPSGPTWDATNWLIEQIGELTFVGLAPAGTPPAALDALRSAYADAARDKEFIDKSVQLNGLPYSFVDAQRGKEIFASLAKVSPDVLATLTRIVNTK